MAPECWHWYNVCIVLSCFITWRWTITTEVKIQDKRSQQRLPLCPSQYIQSLLPLSLTPATLICSLALAPCHFENAVWMDSHVIWPFVSCNVCQSFTPSYCWVVFKGKPQFVPLFTYWRAFGYVQFWATTNEAAMNIHRQVSMCTSVFHSVGEMPRGVIAGSCGYSMFGF